MNLAIELKQEEDGRWIAEIPEIPGVLTYGVTIKRQAGSHKIKVKDIILSSIGLFGWIFLILKILKFIEWNWIIILIPFILAGFIQVIISDTVLGIIIMEKIKERCKKQKASV